MTSSLATESWWRRNRATASVAPVVAVVAVVAAILAPIAYATHRESGVEFVALAAATMAFSIALSAAAARAFNLASRPLTALLFAMLFRLAMPLALVLAVVRFGQERFSATTVLYVVPLFLVMLITETFVAVRHVNAAETRSVRPANNSSSSTIR